MPDAMTTTSIPPSLLLPLSPPTRLGRALRVLRHAVLALVMVVALAAAGIAGWSHHRQHAVFTPAPSDFAIPAEPAALAEGERLFHARGCADCHGEDGAGRVMVDDPGLGRIVSANLTYFASATPQSWSRAVRDGLHADGTPLALMPAGELTPMPDRELAAIVAYVRTLPRVDHALPTLELRAVGRTIDVLGLLALFPAHDIDHRARPADLPLGRNAELGAYLARGCTNCHGAGLSGGAIPGAPPSMGVPRNITFDETGLAGWSEADLRTALREGRTPDGGTLRPEQMPWRSMLRYLSDDEIGALYDHLRTVPHRPEGER